MGNKKNSKSNKTTYNVTIEFTDIDSKTPLEAAKKIAEWLKDGADTFIFDVVDELSNKKFTVDLSEDDEDAVLPND